MSDPDGGRGVREPTRPPRVAALQVLSWHWWVRVIRLAYPFGATSTWAYQTSPHDLGLAPGTAFAVAVLLGAVVGAVWGILDHQDLSERVRACAVLTIVVAVISLIPGVPGNYSLLGPAFQLGLVSGLALLPTRERP